MPEVRPRAGLEQAASDRYQPIGVRNLLRLTLLTLDCYYLAAGRYSCRGWRLESCPAGGVMDLNGAVVLITGGTGVLGQYICRAFARQGAQVAIVYRESKDKAEELAAELTALGPRARAFQAEMLEEASIKNLVSNVVDSYGRIDVLVNNAAYNQWVPFQDLDGMTLDLWEYLMRINLTAPFLCMKSVAPVMKKQKQGSIVNIGSVAGLAPGGSSMAYAVSKAALTHLTRCMAVSLGPDGICVNCVAPGTIEGTRLTARLDPVFVENAVRQSALQRMVKCEDLADQVVTLARSDSTSGEVVVVDSGKVYH